MEVAAENVALQTEIEKTTCVLNKLKETEDEQKKTLHDATKLHDDVCAIIILCNKSYFI